MRSQKRRKLFLKRNEEINQIDKEDRETSDECLLPDYDDMLLEMPLLPPILEREIIHNCDNEDCLTDIDSYLHVHFKKEPGSEVEIAQLKPKIMPGLDLISQMYTEETVSMFTGPLFESRPRPTPAAEVAEVKKTPVAMADDTYPKFPETFADPSYEWDPPLPRWDVAKLLSIDSPLPSTIGKKPHSLESLVKTRSGRARMRTILLSSELLDYEPIVVNSMRVALLQHEKWKTNKRKIDRAIAARQKREEMKIVKDKERAIKKEEKELEKALRLEKKKQDRLLRQGVKIQRQLDKVALKEEKRILKQEKMALKRRKEYEARRAKLQSSSEDDTSESSASSSSSASEY
jgi:hypothetical protein